MQNAFVSNAFHCCFIVCYKAPHFFPESKELKNTISCGLHEVSKASHQKGGGLEFLSNVINW